MPFRVNYSGTVSVATQLPDQQQVMQLTRGLAVLRDLGLAGDDARVNINGGAIGSAQDRSIG